MKIQPRSGTPSKHALFQNVQSGTLNDVSADTFARAQQQRVNQLVIRDDPAKLKLTADTSNLGRRGPDNALGNGFSGNPVPDVATPLAKLLDMSSTSTPSTSAKPQQPKDDVSRSSSPPSKPSPAPAPAPQKSSPAPQKSSSPPAGHKLCLSDDDYATSPTIESLRALTLEQLKSVPNFTIYSKKHGSIQFEAPVDLSGEDDLCKSVLIKAKEVHVYPEDSGKLNQYEEIADKCLLGRPPVPVRQGLNQAALVTLNNCYPIDSTSGKPVTSADDPRVIKKVCFLEEKKIFFCLNICVCDFFR